MTGYVQIYTGDGKGKTTAALGLALRAAGAGLNVFFGQFVKGQRYSEVETIVGSIPSITLRQYGRSCFIRQAPEAEDIRLARDGLAEMATIVSAGQHDIVVFDEVNIAIHFHLFEVDDLLTIIRGRPKHVEIIITGRNADPKLIEAADLVTEMREIKHYYQQNVAARRGIEF